MQPNSLKWVIVGNNVESIIKDLVELALKTEYESQRDSIRGMVTTQINEKLVDLIWEEQRAKHPDNSESNGDMLAKQAIAKQLADGILEKQEVTIQHKPKMNIKLDDAQALEKVTNNLQNIFDNIKKQKVSLRVRVHQAREILLEQEGEKRINKEEMVSEVINNVEQNAIVFIDEIDKICTTHEVNRDGVSRQGVQRDLLPIIEGTTVNTRHGPVSTDHIFFVCSGAFHSAKPSDLMPELQGRLPVRVHLGGLDADSLYQILSQPSFSLYEQYCQLLKVDGINIEIEDDGLKAIGELAQVMNDEVENIGARRLHTLLEQLLKDIMYDSKPGKFVLNRNDITEKLSPIGLQSKKQQIHFVIREKI